VPLANIWNGEIMRETRFLITLEKIEHSRSIGIGIFYMKLTNDFQLLLYIKLWKWLIQIGRMCR
jgi:hypothetical protein